MEYFRRRPVGWREDNRAAIISMSFGGSKTKPEDLFTSLKIIKQEFSTDNTSVSEKFFNKFKHRFTERNPFDE
jgi:hypothetical protein